jgi:membrane dipeptidase
MPKKLYIVIIIILIPAGVFLFKLFRTSERITSEAPVTPVSQTQTIPEKNMTPSAEIKRSNYLDLHNESIVVDTHNDLVWQVFYRGAAFGIKNGSTQSDLPKFREGGLDVQVFAIWIPMNKLKSSYSFTVDQVERLKNFALESPNDIEYASTHDDIMRITGSGKICGLIGIEGGTVVGNDLDNINRLYDMGVRYIGITWNNSNNIASSARDETERGKAGGLTEFGVEVIKRMDEVGMLIDVSHLGEQSFWDITQVSKNPIIASHSNAYTVHAHYRNLTDEQIKAIAKSGGVVQVNFHSDFLGGATIDKVLEHIAHIKNLVGVDYIGIGSDFDGGITPASELYDATRYPVLTQKLVERGYTDEEIKKILGLNFLRVFKQVCG